MSDPLLEKLRFAHSAPAPLSPVIAPPAARAVSDATIRLLWKRRFDTFEMATFLHLSESEIANRLGALRDGGAL